MVILLNQHYSKLSQKISKIYFDEVHFEDVILTKLKHVTNVIIFYQSLNCTKM